MAVRRTDSEQGGTICGRSPAPRPRSQPEFRSSKRDRLRWIAAAVLAAMAALLHPSAASAEDMKARAAASAKPDAAFRARPVLVRQPISAPRWTASAEALFLGRSGAGRQQLVSLIPGDVPWWTPSGPNTTNLTGVEALNSSQLGQRLAAGQKLGLAYRDPSGIGAELTYFSVLGLKVAKATGPENPGQWLVMKAPGTFWQTQDYAYQSMVWRSDTRLHSLEANARLDL